MTANVSVPRMREKDPALDLVALLSMRPPKAVGVELCRETMETSTEHDSQGESRVCVHHFPRHRLGAAPVVVGHSFPENLKQAPCTRENALA